MDPVEMDLSRMCRACKCQSQDMQELFMVCENDSEFPRIDEMLMACTSIQIDKDDGLPNLICNDCMLKLKFAFTFKLQCQTTDVSLREYAKSLRSTQENAENNLLDDLQSMISFKTAESENKEHPKLEPHDDDTNLETLKCDFIEIMDNNQLILTCRQCFKVFTTLDGLKCHKRLHTGALFKCKLCDKEYTRLNHLQRHEMTHGRRKVHVCKICNKTLTRFEHLKRHLVTHLKDKPFSCPKCSRGFNRSENLMNHVERCKGDRIHICDICNKGFNRADSLDVHRRLHENKMPVMPTLENLDNIKEHYIEIEQDQMSPEIFDDEEDDEDYLEERDYFEPQVDITEKEEQLDDKLDDEDDDEEDVKLMIKHELPKSEDPDEGMDDLNESGEENLEMSMHEYAEMDIDSDSSEYTPIKMKKIVTKVKRGRGRPRKHPISSKGPRSRPSLSRIKAEIKDEPLDLDEEGIFSCPICNEDFKRILLLEKHALQHVGAKIFECKTCNKAFSRATHLKRHMTSHSELKPFICEICTKSFNRRDHLTQHMKLHSRAQEFECEICKRPFSRADHLAKHKMSKHNISDKTSGEKKYKCDICQKCFTTEKYRDVHMKAHNGEKNYHCRTCDKAFLSKSHLSEHMKFHNDNSKKFLCSECGQRFIRNDYLVIHMRRHRGEKPFKCKFCGKGFPRTTDLTVHERYHTGEKTHLCVICGRGFGRAYNLTVHMRTHTGEKPYQCSYCDSAFAQGNDLKAHVRRHTGERFQCELCTETFLMGYLLTQHKRTVHGLNVVSNIRRLQPAMKLNPDDPPPITITLPPPVVPSSILNAQLHAQLTMDTSMRPQGLILPN